jgi:hypothetical protein
MNAHPSIIKNQNNKHTANTDNMQKNDEMAILNSSKSF